MSINLLDSLLEELGEAGQRMVQLGAAEGAAGNLSIFVRNTLEPDKRFEDQGAWQLPVHVPALAGGWVLVTASGRRLRDIGRTPHTAVCLLQIRSGEYATLYGMQGIKPTSELNTHIAVHHDQVTRHKLEIHAVAHAQPLRLTYLSHIAGYSEPERLSRRLLRWQPEMIMEFPEGIGMLGFQMPGSNEQTHVTVKAMQAYRAIVWQKHGIVTRAASIGKAADLIEYAESAAHYEYLNLCAGEPTQGLTDAELRLISERLGLPQTLF